MSQIPINFPTNGWQFGTPLRITDDGRVFGVGVFLGVPHCAQLSPRTDGSYDFADLGALAGSPCSICAFNDFGWAAGNGAFPQNSEAFLFRDGKLTLLGNLGSPSSYGLGLNNLGDVVGQSNSQAYQVFLWRDGVMYNLNSCIPTNSGWVLVNANGVNDAGWIVGHGILNGTGNINGEGITNGGHRAFLLNPVPGSGQGFNLTLASATTANRLRFHLTRQPTTNTWFEASSDLTNWMLVIHTVDGKDFLIEGNDADLGFYRAAFRP